MQAEELQSQEAKEKYSPAVTQLASQVSSTFMTYRQLMRKYQTNIELVDPQLKNNEPLVKLMTDFENAWSLAQSQIGEPKFLE